MEEYSYHYGRAFISVSPKGIFFLGIDPGYVPLRHHIELAFRITDGKISKAEKVNGIVADYDTDKTYWSITKGGEETLGASATVIADGDCYELTKTVSAW